MRHPSLSSVRYSEYYDEDSVQREPLASKEQIKKLVDEFAANLYNELIEECDYEDRLGYYKEYKPYEWYRDRDEDFYSYYYGPISCAVNSILKRIVQELYQTELSKKFTKFPKKHYESGIGKDDVIQGDDAEIYRIVEEVGEYFYCEKLSVPMQIPDLTKLK